MKRVFIVPNYLLYPSVIPSQLLHPSLWDIQPRDTILNLLDPPPNLPFIIVHFCFMMSFYRQLPSVCIGIRWHLVFAVEMSDLA